MGQRKAVTRASAVRYKRAGRAGNKIILDELCATGWHRDHSRKALRQTLKPTLVRPAELVLLNKIWVLQSEMTNYFSPQQKLVSKVRHGAKVTKKYDLPTTPHQRADRHQAVTTVDTTIMIDTYASLNPAAIQRQIQALTAELLTLTTSKAAATSKPRVQQSWRRASGT